MPILTVSYLLSFRISTKGLSNTGGSGCSGGFASQKSSPLYIALDKLPPIELDEPPTLELDELLPAEPPAVELEELSVPPDELGELPPAELDELELPAVELEELPVPPDEQDETPELELISPCVLELEEFLSS